MIDGINYETVKANFDDLLSRRIISYSPAEIIQLEDNGYKLEYHITDTITKKHQAEKAFHLPPAGAEPAPSDKARYFGPGSDIADSDPKLQITIINDTHRLVISKFCIAGPQLMLLTMDSYRRQRQQLDLDDIEAAYLAISSLELSHFAFYNCGLAAGSSREHKHIQILLLPGPMFPDDPDFDPKNIPFKFFLKYLDRTVTWSKSRGIQLRDIYYELLAQARLSLNISCEEDCPHNMVLVREWMVVIPRRSNDFHGVTANSAGMMGYVWLGTHNQLKRWKEVGPARALAGLGVPSTTECETSESH